MPIVTAGLFEHTARASSVAGCTARDNGPGNHYSCVHQQQRIATGFLPTRTEHGGGTGGPQGDAARHSVMDGDRPPSILSRRNRSLGSGGMGDGLA
jgi:hypothetical protein